MFFRLETNLSTTTAHRSRPEAYTPGRCLVERDVGRAVTTDGGLEARIVPAAVLRRERDRDRRDRERGVVDREVGLPAWGASRPCSPGRAAHRKRNDDDLYTPSARSCRNTALPATLAVCPVTPEVKVTA